MKIKTILVPHDGEQMSDRALMYASEFAKALGAEIILLHVIEEIAIPPSLVLGNDRVLIARARRSIASDIERQWNRFAQDKIRLLSFEKVKMSSEVLTGDPAEQILKSAKDADLIIMGSRRLQGISKVVVALGSVARKVSERAHCPVMLMH